MQPQNGQPHDRQPQVGGRRGRLAWAFYDWANSSFAAIISTFVFPAYFARQVVGDEALGTTLWGYTVGVAGLLVAIAGPVLGAVADQYGRRKPMLLFFTLICLLATAALWWVRPGSDYLVMAMLLAGIATVGAELAVVPYNAMLPDITPRQRLGRWSGWAWGLGYAGGLAALLLALFGLINPQAWLDLPRDDAAHIRATFVLVALWYGLFALPLFFFTPDLRTVSLSPGRAVRRGLAQLAESLRQVRQYSHLVRFLIARLFFIDGLATLFAFGGIYAAGSFGFDEREVLLFGIALNVSTGIGAVAFAWLDDLLGSRTVILVSILGVLIPAAVILMIESTLAFWLLGLFMGLFIGPVQAASRSYMARVAPPEWRTQFFGLLSFSGKATVFLGPLLVGWVTGLFDSQRAGMTVIPVLLFIGLVLMWTVPSSREVRGRGDSAQ